MIINKRNVEKSLGQIRAGKVSQVTASDMAEVRELAVAALRILDTEGETIDVEEGLRRFNARAADVLRATVILEKASKLPGGMFKLSELASHALERVDEEDGFPYYSPAIPSSADLEEARERITHLEAALFRIVAAAHVSNAAGVPDEIVEAIADALEVAGTTKGPAR